MSYPEGHYVEEGRPITLRKERPCTFCGKVLPAGTVVGYHSYYYATERTIGHTYILPECADRLGEDWDEDPDCPHGYKCPLDPPTPKATV